MWWGSLIVFISNMFLQPEEKSICLTLYCVECLTWLSGVSYLFCFGFFSCKWIMIKIISQNSHYILNNPLAFFEIKIKIQCLFAFIGALVSPVFWSILLALEWQNWIVGGGPKTNKSNLLKRYISLIQLMITVCCYKLLYHTYKQNRTVLIYLRTRYIIFLLCLNGQNSVLSSYCIVMHAATNIHRPHSFLQNKLEKWIKIQW